MRKGSVVQRGDRFSVVIDLGRDTNGKRIRKWHSGYATRDEAEAAQIEILSSLAKGAYVSPSKVTLGEWLESWLENRQGLADTTRVGYEVDVRRINKALGSRRLRDVTPMLIAAYYAELSQTFSPKTVKNTHGVLHKALKDAVRDGVLPRNPADSLELPRLERPDTKAWTVDELRTFLAYVANHRLYAAWMLACSTGMRRSELLGLRWKNTDLENSRVVVVDTLVPVKNEVVLRLGETKSKRSRRVVALDVTTVAVVRTHKKRQNEERLLASTAWSDHDLVFTDEIGEPLNPARFTRLTKQLAGRAGVTPLTPHQAARHTWASLALSEGVNPKVVQERLGHSSIAITLDRYSHLIDGMDKDAAETVAALVNRTDARS